MVIYSFNVPFILFTDVLGLLQTHKKHWPIDFFKCYLLVLILY